MKFKNVDDSKYFVRFMRATEEKIKSMTCAEFILYLRDNAVDTDIDFICIDGKREKCFVYTIREEESTTEKDFIVTEDNRVFYYRSLNAKHELVDYENNEEAINEKYKAEYEKLKYDISIGLYDISIIAFTLQYGRLLAFSELSVFTSIERDNEDAKLYGLYLEWEKRYYSKEEK